MNASPALPVPPPQSAAGAHASCSLAERLYDGFYLLFLLRSGHPPRDAEYFRDQVRALLDEFDHAARRDGHEAIDVLDARYAFCATLDETILASAFPLREAWARRPLQLTMFGEQLAGEGFFERLEAARSDGSRRLPALEVFHLCLLLGFKGRYLLEGQAQLDYLTARLGEQVAHFKGDRAPFAPHWAAPDRLAHRLARVLPMWVLAAVLALGAAGAYLLMDRQLDLQTTATLAAYHDLVQAPARAPRLTISLP